MSELSAGSSVCFLLEAGTRLALHIRVKSSRILCDVTLRARICVPPSDFVRAMECRTLPLGRHDRLCGTLSYCSGASVRWRDFRVFSYFSGAGCDRSVVPRSVRNLCVLFVVLVILSGCVLQSKSGKNTVRVGTYVLRLHFVVKTFYCDAGLS